MSSFVSKEKRNLLPLHIDSSCMVTTRLFKALFLCKLCCSWSQSDCQASHLLLVSVLWSQVLAHLIGWRTGLHGHGNPSLALRNVFLFTLRHCRGIKVELPNLWREHADILRDRREVSKICRHKNLHMCWQTGNLLLSNYVVPVVRN